MIKQKAQLFIKEYRFILIIVFLYTFILSFLTIGRYTHYLTGYYDLGVFINPLYNTTHGNFLLQYNVGKEINTLGTHQMYTLIPLALIYRIFPSAYFLLFIQSFIVGLGAFPLYLICKNVLAKKSLWYILPCLFLMSPTVQWTNVYDFHPETFVTTFILFLWYFLLKRKILPAIIFMLAIIASKEDMGLAVSLISLFYFFQYKEIKEKFILGVCAIIALSISIIEVEYIIPLFNTIHKSYFLIRYEYLGTTPKKIFLNLLTHPKLLFSSLFQPHEKIDFLFEIFYQTGFLAIFSFAIIGAFSQIGMDLLGSTPMHQITYQYTTIINALLWISTIYALKHIFFYSHRYLKNYANLLINCLCIYLIICSIHAAFLYGPILNSTYYKQQFHQDPKRIALLNQMIQKVPANVSVDASDFIADKVSDRKIIQIFPQQCNADYIISEPIIVNGANNFQICKKIIMKDYIYVFRQGDYFVAKKR